MSKIGCGILFTRYVTQPIHCSQSQHLLCFKFICHLIFINYMYIVRKIHNFGIYGYTVNSSLEITYELFNKSKPPADIVFIFLNVKLQIRLIPGQFYFFFTLKMQYHLRMNLGLSLYTKHIYWVIIVSQFEK